MAESICGQEDCPKPYEFCEACVRVDQNERIAQAIEAQREQFIRVAHADADSILVMVYDDAIRIARSGGSDE